MTRAMRRRALAAAVLAVVLATGCAKGGGKATTGPATASSGPTPYALSEVIHGSSPGGLAQGDPERGRYVFSANCARCHGATGAEGDVGPSLRDEKDRKEYAAVVAWIKDPDPPMIKLYPAPLSETDVENVAAYVERL